MKLHLKNFCCWENKEFIFPTEGNILISAPSGKGKTSIIRAIIFAIFGDGQKIIHHGKRSCSVELWFRDLHIFRSKGPCRLIVNDAFEDKAGQHIIGQYFNDQMFHLEQGNGNSFAMLSANDKLAYLEKIIFNNIDIVDIKTKTKKIIKERENMLLVKKTELATTEEMLTTLNVCDEVKLPLGIVYSFDLVERKQIEYNEMYELYKKYKHSKSIHDNYTTRIIQLDNSIDTETTLLYQDTTELEECEKHLDALSDIKESLNENEKLLHYILQTEKYTRLKQEYIEQRDIYDKTIKSEKNELDTKIEDLKSIISTIPFKSLKDCRFEITVLNTQISNWNEWNRIHDESNNIVIHNTLDYFSNLIYETTQLLQTSKNTLREMESLYNCPKCETLLKLNDNILMEETEFIAPTSEHNIPMLEERIRKLELERQEIITLTDRKKQLLKKMDLLKGTFPKDIDIVETKLKEYDIYYEKFITHQGLLNDYSSQLNVVVGKYDKIKTHLSQLGKKYKKIKSMLQTPEPYVVIPDKDILQKTIYELQQKTGIYDHYISTKTKLVSRIASRHTTLKRLRCDRETIVKQLPVLEQSVNEGDIEAYRTELELLKNYKNYHASISMYQRYDQKRLSLEMDISEYEHLLSTSMRFREKIVEAETIALTNLVYTINTNIQLYLDDFFEKDPLHASISCFKLVKNNKKPQINIVIQHKGNQVELQSLSGGERDRVILAFALTLSDLSNSPLLLLDECVSSLDQENADTVFSSIKTQCNNKLVIVVAHQIVTGMFDEIIRL